MAKHKAATEVSLVPTVERRGFGLFVERYWKVGVALAALIALLILVGQYMKVSAKHAERDSWRALNASVTDQLVARGAANYYVAPAGEPSKVKEAAEAVEKSVAGPWAWAAVATSYAQKQSFNEADSALEQLRKSHPESFLASARFRFGEDATPRSLVEQARRNYQDWAKWKSEHSSLFENPELPPSAPKVRVRTDAGSFLLGLYTDRAPAHAENFLKLAREGYYEGTLFHRVIGGFLIQGGDPNSRDGDPSTWGQGGPETGVEAEKSGLRHFEGVLAAAKSEPKGPSSGSQFYITLRGAHEFDEDYTVFGKVLEGLEVVREISNGTLAEGTADRPASPVKILGVDVL